MKKSSKSNVSRDPKKDEIIKGLSEVLLDQGFTVRREELKQGHGWKAMSGSCRAVNKKFIFVDKKLPQGDQITFLLSKFRALDLQIPESIKDKLPESAEA